MAKSIKVGKDGKAITVTVPVDRMNIGELRELIKDLPANLPVRLESENPYGEEKIANPVTGYREQRDAFYLEGIW